MIRAWKVFRIYEARLAATAVAHLYDGPVARSRKPYSVNAWLEIEADPIGAVQRYGDEWVLGHVRTRPPEHLIRPPSYDLATQRFTIRGWGVWNPYGGDLPAPDPKHGFYAFDSREEAERQYSKIDALAEVDLFGRVVEHEKGYRAEAFRFSRIYMPDTHAVHREAFESLYDCEVEVWPTSERKSEPTTSSLSAPSGRHQHPSGRSRKRDRIASWFRRARNQSEVFDFLCWALTAGHTGPYA